MSKSRHPPRQPPSPIVVAHAGTPPPIALTLDYSQHVATSSKNEATAATPPKFASVHRLLCASRDHDHYSFTHACPCIRCDCTRWNSNHHLLLCFPLPPTLAVASSSLCLHRASSRYHRRCAMPNTITAMPLSPAFFLLTLSLLSRV